MRSVPLGEAALGEIGGMVTARGRRSSLRMREEENESEEEEMKEKSRERLRGARGEREELIKKRKKKNFPHLSRPTDELKKKNFVIHE